MNLINVLSLLKCHIFILNFKLLLRFTVATASSGPRIMTSEKKKQQMNNFRFFNHCSMSKEQKKTKLIILMKFNTHFFLFGFCLTFTINEGKKCGWWNVTFCSESYKGIFVILLWKPLKDPFYSQNNENPFFKFECCKVAPKKTSTKELLKTINFPLEIVNNTKPLWPLERFHLVLVSCCRAWNYNFFVFYTYNVDLLISNMLIFKHIFFVCFSCNNRRLIAYWRHASYINNRHFTYRIVSRRINKIGLLKCLHCTNMFHGIHFKEFRKLLNSNLKFH